MSIAEYIFLGSAIIAALLGLYLVILALSIFRQQRLGKLQHGPLVDLEVFGAKIKGGRPLAIFVIGTLLITFPLKYSVDILEPSSSPSIHASVVPVPEDVEEVDSLPDLSQEGFHLTKDFRIIDLRSRILVPEDKKDERYSPVTWTRYTLLRRLSADKKTLDFEFSTSGVDVYPRCLTHEYSLKKLAQPDVHGDVELKTRWQLQADVAGEPIDNDFLVLNEVTFWNAFTGEEQEWAGMGVPQEVDVIGLVLLFPQDKPFKSYSLYAYPHGSREKKSLRDPSIVIPSENNQVLLWKVENPKVGHTYQINWTW